MSKHLLILGSLLGVVAVAWQAPPPAQKGATKAAPPKAVAAKPKAEPGKPYTIERLIEKLDIIRKNRYALNENILKNQLKVDGIGFVPSADDLVRLKKAGASEDFIRFVVDLKKEAVAEAPPPPAPVVVPPKPKVGRMVLTCKPVDCEVMVNGEQRGRTNKGMFTLEKMPEGNVKIVASAMDHTADRDAHNAVIKDGETINVDFVLKPTQAALDRTGADFAQRMINAIGGEQGVKEFQRLRVSGGKLMWSKAQGAPNTWNFMAYLKMPDQVKYMVSRGGKQQEIWKLDTGFGPLPNDKGEEMEEALRDFWDYQFGHVVEKLVSPSLKRTARQLRFNIGDSPTFRLEGTPDTYVVTLDQQNLPKEIRVESAGLSNGLRLQYGDYVKTGNSFYPKVTYVGWPGAAQRGTEVRLESVATGPDAVKDADVVNKKAKGRKR